ncbi:LacI family DNA-binding transcriptional regulator [Thalassospira mesophila]|uniref:LacI family transcriptional regulator n=1 Tax=Thalassospira mesophila TaxID=1293891 RepID=A0A1Y2L4P6_9PROT|nr:LacI family DNA-binding transcriptional regulator [Thalassospira mesophila]OSQ39513.1 LacI family transcriptional regulator [Thalassospira mesophila]
MSEKTATIEDVAQQAGVSIATVSRALHKPQLVSQSTREKVQHAIAATGYTANVMARNLRLSRSGMILLLVPDIGNPFFAEILSGIEQGASRAGYNVLIGDTQNDPEREATYAAYLRSNQADAMILLNGHLPSPLSEAPRIGTPPIVAVCERIPGSNLPTVIIDNQQAALEATRHLTQLGHARIAHIAGPAQNILTIDRVAGFNEAMAEAGLRKTASIDYSPDFGIEAGIAAARRLLRSDTPPTAFFCASDGMAIGAIVAAKELGLNVPRDISVVGFDDIHLAANYDPPLTTIRQPRRRLGEQAIALVLERLDKSRPAPDTHADNNPVIINTELIIRASTAPCTNRDPA